MSMREEVLKLGKAVGFTTYKTIGGTVVVDSDYVIITDELERFYQAAYQRGFATGAKAMQDEAANVCDARQDGALHAAEFAGRNAVIAAEEAEHCAERIRAINLDTLVNSTENL